MLRNPWDARLERPTAAVAAHATCRRDGRAQEAGMSKCNTSSRLPRVE